MANGRQPLNILVVYAHPADSACEASGTMALHADLGDRITAVICSDGERHHADLFLDDDEGPGRTRKTQMVRATLDEIKRLKRREAERAADILGVRDVRFLGWPDDLLIPSQERISQLGEILLDVKPDLLVTHLPVSTAPGVDPHTHVGRMVIGAREAAGTRIRQLDGVAAHHVRELIYFPMGGEIADSRDFLAQGIVCDVWIDVTPVIARKVQAMDQIVTQGYHGQTARKIVEAREGRWGMLAGVSYAEPFLRSGGRTYSELPIAASLNKPFVPNDLPGDQIIAQRVPLAVRDD